MSSETQKADTFPHERPSVEPPDTTLAQNLTSDLHDIYDPVLSKSLPIYFGPLLGELFLADF